MYFHWIVLTLLIVAGGVLSQTLHQDDINSEHATLDALSRGMLVYRSAAAEYARMNPGFSGTPSDTALSLPAWYNKPVGVTAYVAGGSSYTYYAQVAPGLPAALVTRTESTVVGINRAGVLVSPTSGNTGIALPGAIPDGAVVAFN